MKKWELSTVQSEYTLHSESSLVGDDLLTCIWGGTQPHIGAVALAMPRPSGADRTVTSSTSSVLTLPGHKEDTVVKIVAERLSATLNRTVVVTAGIHWDHLDEDGVAQIVENCRWLAERIVEVVEQES